MERIFSSRSENVSLERDIGTEFDILRIILGWGEHRTSVINPELKIISQGEMIGPFLKLPHHEMNELLRSFVEIAWDQGIRPTGFDDFKAELKATKYHLQDMRSLAFKGKAP